MFYLASKILWFIAQPSTLILSAVLVGVVLMAMGKTRRGARISLSALAVLSVVGLTSIADVFYLPLENRFPRADVAALPITGIIVLGGAEDDSGESRELMSLGDSGERLTEGAALARRLPDAKLVWSGGSGVLSTRQDMAGRHAQRLWASLGIAPARIILETNSKTTYENAIESWRVLSPKPGERYALVTSAWHMPRAIGCFRTAGFDVVAWPADYRTDGSVQPFFFAPSLVYGLARFDVIAKEYVGLLAYRVTGRTPTLWPAP